MPDPGIFHPEIHGLHSETYHSVLEISKMKVEIAQLTQWYEAISADLQSIFLRIEAGQSIEFHYPNGQIFLVTGTRMVAART